MVVHARTQSGSGKSKWKKIRSSDIKGLKYFRILQPLLKHLHDVGTKRDRAHNRRLYMDHYCILLLLWFAFVTASRSRSSKSESSPRVHERPQLLEHRPGQRRHAANRHRHVRPSGRADCSALSCVQKSDA